MPKAKWVDLEKFQRWYKFMNKIRAFAAVCGGLILVFFEGGVPEPVYLVYPTGLFYWQMVLKQCKCEIKFSGAYMT